MKKVEIVKSEQGGDAFEITELKAGMSLRVGRDEESSANVRVIVDDGEDELFVLRFESDTRIMVEAAKLAPNGEEYDNVTWNSNS